LREVSQTKPETGKDSRTLVLPELPQRERKPITLCCAKQQFTLNLRGVQAELAGAKLAMLA
jgi:hypothetical protein